MAKVFIEVENFRLREFVKSDAGLLAKLNEDERVTQALFEGKYLADSKNAECFVDAAIERYKSNPRADCWVAERKYANFKWRFQGWFNLSPIPANVMSDDEYNRHIDALELGIRLATDAWGKTLSFQLGAALLYYAFSGYKTPYVLVHCLPNNRSAVFCTLFFGFQFVNTLSYFDQRAFQFKLTPDRYDMWNQLSLSERRARALLSTRKFMMSKSVEPAVY